MSRGSTLVDFQAAYNLIVPVIEKKYGVEVMISDVVDPNTGPAGPLARPSGRSG